MQEAGLRAKEISQVLWSQSPFRRGDECKQERPLTDRERLIEVSIPFQAGR